MGNVDFRVVPQPQTVGQGISQGIQGLSGLGQVMDQREQRAKAEAEANRPVNPLQQVMIDTMMKYTQRLRAGEDPNQVTAEARQDPIILQYQQAQRGGGLAAPAAGPQAAPVPAPNAQAYPDIGMRNGQPQMASPGTFDPTRGQSLGAMPPSGQAPQGPVSGALAMGSQPSLARISAAPVMTGNTQPPRPEFGSAPQAAVSQTPAPRAAPAPYQYTQRDFTQAAPLIPTVLAAQGREQVAGQNADVRMQVELSRANTAQFLGLLKAQGMSDAQASREAIAFAKMDVSQQQNVLNNATKLQTAQIGADADISKAQISAGSRERIAAERPGREDSAEKELRTVTQSVTQLLKNPEWYLHPESSAAMARYNARIAELQSALGRPAGATSPQTQAPAPAPRRSAGAIVRALSEEDLASLGDRDRAALEWAKAHPNDPKAEALYGKIKAKLGR